MPPIQERASRIRRQAALPTGGQLADDLGELGDVEHTEVYDEFAPPRVRVTLRKPYVSDEVGSWIEQADARVVPESIGANGGTLRFDVVVEPGFEMVGNREVRAYGNSVSLTFPPESVEVSDIDIGDMVQIHAADGAILLVKRFGEE